ncbi:DUF5412 domain-containing protein [Paenibacillus sp. SC116]|uniref:DUF5412 domain-containing protein n=1 Tax=Paenibacillus sp. SC116 TaxID=2968986 RepID=UPI00215A5D6A|nr:DUF5412 domain-containing protein [Paenibacillus sp. SC116]MCR8843635.1 DUF5412 domain-containing protein [Paenibacillus sp. SC116]
MNKISLKWIIALGIIIILALYVYLKSFTLLLLPEGDLFQSVESPDRSYTFHTYLVNAGGATGGFAIRGEIEDRQNGRKETIYWQYKIDTAVIQWLDNTNVEINGIKLNIKTDKYDYREHQ